MSESIAITVVGSGYVGLVAAACFAEIGHGVLCVDNDEDKLNKLNQGVIPIHEEFLPELLGRHRGSGQVQFTTDLSRATHESQVIFIAVGTPQSETGNADLSYVDAVASEIARSIHSYRVIVEKSTVPVYTNDWIRRTIERNGVSRSLFDVTSNPEFLREGTAVKDFLHPDRIVLGADSENASSLLAAIYEPLTSGSYYERSDAVPGSRSAADLPPILQTSTKAAEIIKHASNAFLAMKISFINVVANLCEAVDADVEHVANGMGLDKRIGNRFLSAGIGYGGSCFPKDVAAFRYVAQQLGTDFGLLEELEKINELQKERFFQKIRSALWTLRKKRLGVLGLAFKGGTDDIRESPALEIIQMLLDAGASICAHDPAAIERAKMEMPPHASLRYTEDPYAAADNADALLILTDWAEFSRLDLKRLRYTLRYPIIIDGRNLFDPWQMHYFCLYHSRHSTASPYSRKLTRSASNRQDKKEFAFSVRTFIFACVHNAGRSQMSAAFFNQLVDGAKAHGVSAGTHPADHVHPVVVDAMREVGIDLSDAKPQKLTTELAQDAEMLITMGCGDECPYVPGLIRDDWPLPDPKGQGIEAVRQTRDDIKRRVMALIQQSQVPVPTEATAR